MTSEELERRLWQEIESYEYGCDPAVCFGNSWSPERVRQNIELLRASIVKPYVQRVELRETAEQIGRESPEYAEYWVVAHGSGDYVEWYDAQTDRFGLAVRRAADAPVSIGVYGDFVGAFMAM